MNFSLKSMSDAIKGLFKKEGESVSFGAVNILSNETIEENRAKVEKLIDEFLALENRRSIREIAVHCTATKAADDVTIDRLDAWAKERGYKKQPGSGRYCGYHYIIDRKGMIMLGRDLQEIGAHVAGHNSFSIGVCYVGGMGRKGNLMDTRTKAQKETLEWLIKELKTKLKVSDVRGHRDFLREQTKEGCPCFDAMEEYKDL